MKEAYPYGPLVANVSRRVLYILRDEYQITMREGQRAVNDGECEEEGTEVSGGSFAGGQQVFNPALV